MNGFHDVKIQELTIFFFFRVCRALKNKMKGRTPQNEIIAIGTGSHVQNPQSGNYCVSCPMFAKIANRPVQSKQKDDT